MGQNEILYYGSWMHGLSDDRNCEKTCIFVGAFGSRSILFVDRIWYLYFLCKKRSCSSCQFKFPFYWNRCIAWSSWNCYFVCDSSVIISLGERLMIICR